MGLLEEMQAAVEEKEKELGRKLTKEVKFGFAAFGLSIVGYLLFTALLFAVLAVSNSVLFAKAKKAKS